MPFSGSQVTRTGPFGMPRPPYPGFSAQVTAAVSGTIGDGSTESELVSSGGTIIVTVAGDTWVASGATFNAQRQNLIDGLDSDGSATNGWNNEVRDALDVSAVVRTSDTVVTITVPATSGYAIDTDETITVTVHEDALSTTTSPVTATPTFDVTADAVSEEQPSGGWMFFSAYEAELQRRRSKEDERKRLLEELEEIEDEASREIAHILHEQDAEETEEEDKKRLRKLVKRVSRQELLDAFGERIAAAYERAYEKATYSSLEALVRETKRAQEEEEFLILAIMMSL